MKEYALWAVIALLLVVWLLGLMYFPVGGAINFLPVVAGFLFVIDVVFVHRTAP